MLEAVRLAANGNYPSKCFTKSVAAVINGLSRNKAFSMFWHRLEDFSSIFMLQSHKSGFWKRSQASVEINSLFTQHSALVNN